MTGVGRAGGAATIVNAMATGRGVAFGLAFRVEVRVTPSTAYSVHAGGRRLDPGRARLAIESARCVTTAPMRIEVDSDIPPERGLKSSSAVAVAAIRATLHQVEERWSDARILKTAAEAGLRSGTSLTGAYDDAAACLLGGVVFTDNRRRRVMVRRRIPPGLVALVSLGHGRLPTAKVRGTDFERVRSLVEDAERLAREGDLRSAMLLNTAAYAPLFGHRTRFTADMVRAGAYAVGLSGKGPAEVALVERPCVARLHRARPTTLVVDVRNGRAR